ncbi:YihY/virulence factor BrkB family protein [Weissella viridescens]|uniref:YihY/virulence factor BrkB family protein n=2 Tax=Weissella viridescens TaxID=1629 RepID=UPI001D0602AD|nr:YihY/virulence factor BrkB family protein [Weissella viridescens]MCB6840487.1 YihY/virulence factor BrkB family protein [Weissella viridescens]MCB6847220.1 YihY/virulence factor BrkB family protein [Weissella viridescens]WJI91214.1 YihY/virulence factor BrkB family protein [Weissella viridescens]
MKKWVDKLTNKAEQWHIPQLLTFWKRGNAAMVGPTIAYYTIVALVPLIMTIGSIVSLLGVNKAQIHDTLKVQMPTGVADIVIPIVDSVLRGGFGTLSISILVAIWSASSILSTIRKAFNEIYGSDVVENGLLTRIVSFLWMLVLLTAAVAVMIANSVLPAIVKALPSAPGISLLKDFASQSWIYAFVALMVLFSLFNYLIPAEKMQWKPVILGSFIEIVLLLLLNSGFGIYSKYALKNASFYQSLGSLLVLLIYLNLVAMVMVVAQILIAWFMTFLDKPEKKKILESK